MLVLLHHCMLESGAERRSARYIEAQLLREAQLLMCVTAQHDMRNVRRATGAKNI